MMHATGRHFLQIPGPTNCPLPVLAAIAQPTIDHRGPEFGKLAREVLSGIRTIFKTKHPVIIYPGSGTGAWEAAIVNTLSPGDKVVMYETGQFATLWNKLAGKFGIETDFIKGDWRTGCDVAAIEARLVADKAHAIKGVLVVHNETSTGATSDIAAVRRAIDAAGGDTAWRKLSSRVTTFKMDLENQGVQGYGKVYSKAPDMSATETTMTALGKKLATGWEYFDGQGGAEAYTFMPAAEKYTGLRLDDVKLANAFYGILDWKTLFKSVVIKRTGKVGDDECWVVEFTPHKGTAYSEFYSTKTFLLRKREGVITSSTSDQKIPYSMTFDDYRDIDGIKVAFKTTAYNIGNGNIVTTFTDVKHNVKLDDKMFTPRKP